MANKIRYQCSNCGQHGVTIPFPSIPESMFFEGFRAHGDVLYCPDCVKTWKERMAWNMTSSTKNRLTCSLCGGIGRCRRRQPTRAKSKHIGATAQAILRR